MDESSFVAFLQKELADSEQLRVGIGDDCAVWETDAVDTASTDTLVEDVHFKREWCTPSDVAWKVMAVSLSDIAAMGAAPVYALLNLSLPRTGIEEFIESYVGGLKEITDFYTDESFRIVGGDLSSTGGPVVTSSTLLGSTGSTGPKCRSDAELGDIVFVSGEIGNSAGGLEVLSGDAGDKQRFPELIESYRRPRPDVELGQKLGELSDVHALIDVSDGLALDLQRILEASEVGADIQFNSVPISDELARLADQGKRSIEEMVLSGGEDYRLLGTAAPDQFPEVAELSSDIEAIGEVKPATCGLNVFNEAGDKLGREARGFDHFRGVRNE